MLSCLHGRDEAGGAGPSCPRLNLGHFSLFWHAKLQRYISFHLCTSISLVNLEKSGGGEGCVPAVYRLSLFQTRADTFAVGKPCDSAMLKPPRWSLETASENVSPVLLL